jgi:hypothetical protein
MLCVIQVVEDESSLPQSNARTNLARFNEQIQPIYDLLKEVEDVRLAPSLLEPEPTDIRKLTRFVVFFVLLAFCVVESLLLNATAVESMQPCYFERGRGGLKKKN